MAYGYELEPDSPASRARDSLFPFLEDYLPAEPKPDDELALVERHLTPTESEEDE